MSAKKLFQVSMLVEERALHEVMTIASGKSYNLTVVAVSSDTAEPAAKPEPAVVRHRAKHSMRMWLEAYLPLHETFDTKMLSEAAIAAGFQKGSIYGAITNAIKLRLIKRTAPGEYAVTGKAPPSPVKRGRPPFEAKRHGGTGQHHSRAPKNGVSMRQQVLGLLKESNGTPLALGDMKKQLAENGFAVTGVSPVLAVLLKKKLIKRPSEGHYQLTAKGEHAEVQRPEAPPPAANGAMA